MSSGLKPIKYSTTFQDTMVFSVGWNKRGCPPTVLLTVSMDITQVGLITTMPLLSSVELIDPRE
jgi:hypothetical protein